MFAAALLLCAGLAGCDWPCKVTASAPAAEPLVPPQAAVPPPYPVPQAIPHGHRYASQWRRRYSAHHSYAEYSEGSASSYSESQSGEFSEQHSSSRVEIQGGVQQSAWTDGYGRSHYAAVADANPATLSHTEIRKRLAPWHNYDKHCKNQD
jgi:hypothetical protein